MASSMKWLWKKSAEAVLEMLRDTRIGCISTRRVLPEEALGDEMALVMREKREGRVPRTCNFLSLFSPGGRMGLALFPCLFLWSLSYFFPLLGESGEKEKGVPCYDR